MTAANLQPDRASIADHLHHITRRWRELEEPCLLETVHLTAQDKADVRDVAHFTLDRVNEAADHIAAMNGHGLNSYVVVNPVSGMNRPKVGKRAAAEHILAAFFHWADADDEAAADNIRNFAGPRPTFVVLTGTTPCKRPHVYWELEDPVRNLAAWSETQRAIARTLKSDGAVVDPPRIMRVAGTVNWPKPQKVAKGYVAEVCRLTIHNPDDRPPISADRMARVFATPKDEAKGDKGETFENFGEQPKGRTVEDYLALLKGARTDGEKHAAVRNLTWALAGNGVPRALCEALIRDVCPVWDDNVQTLIETAYRGNFHERIASERAKEEREQLGSFDTTPVSMDELRGVSPRRWLYGRKIVRGFTSVLAAPPGVGKSSWTTAITMDIASGVNTLHDDPHEAMPVWLYNLEDPRDETLRKIYAAVRFKKLPERVLSNVIVGSGRDRSLIVAEEVERGVYVAMPDVDALIEAIKAAGIGVLIVDPAVRAHRLPENDNKAIDLMMDQFARIAHEADCGIILVHHTKKGFVGGEMDSVRGASAMVGAARVALTMQAMSPQEADDMSIPEAERRFFVRIDNAKANLAPQPAKAEWIKLENQPLDNGTDEYPDGDFVQVVTKWEPPDAWDGLGPFMVEIFDKIERGLVLEDGTQTPYRPDTQSKERWVGHVITNVMGADAKTPAQCKAIIAQWIGSGLLEIREDHCPIQRKPKKMVFVKNRPTDD